MMVLLTRKYPANLCLYTPWRKIIHGISQVFLGSLASIGNHHFQELSIFPHGASCGMPRETREALPHCQNWELHHAGVRLSPTQRFAIPTRWPAFFWCSAMLLQSQIFKKNSFPGIESSFWGDPLKGQEFPQDLDPHNDLPDSEVTRALRFKIIPGPIIASTALSPLSPGGSETCRRARGIWNRNCVSTASSVAYQRFSRWAADSKLPKVDSKQKPTQWISRQIQ